MRTIIIDKSYYNLSVDDLMKKYPKIRILHSNFLGLCEDKPVVYSINDEEFFGSIVENVLEETLLGHREEYHIQTSRLFDVSMKKYQSNPHYRNIVEIFVSCLEEMDCFDKDSIYKCVNNCIVKSDYEKDDVVNTLKYALIKTTLGPDLDVLLEGYGKKAVLRKYVEYLRSYRFRI